VVRGPSGTRLEGIAPSNIYRSADGSWVVIAANQDTVFARLCKAMGRPELASDDRFATHGARGRNQDELDEIIGAWAADRQPGDIIETLSAAGVIAGPINTVAELLPQAAAERAKLGFPVPLGHWLSGGMYGFAEQVIRTAQTGQWLNKAAATELLRRFRAGDPEVNWRQVWLLVVFSLWHQIYVERVYDPVALGWEPAPVAPISGSNTHTGAKLHDRGGFTTP